MAEYKLAENRKTAQSAVRCIWVLAKRQLLLDYLSTLVQMISMYLELFHRSHSHLLALNPDFYKLFCEVLGRNDGFSKGMGGSMHLWDAPSGFMGSVPIVAGTVPLATGAALSAKLSRKPSIAVTYLGDGAVEEALFMNHSTLLAYKSCPLSLLSKIIFSQAICIRHRGSRQMAAIVSPLVIGSVILC